jgi:O-methyltransferase involved in polyketide biosynthesis
MTKESILDITDISETLLLTLYARALESQSTHPILVDHKAVEITQTLNQLFKESDSPLHQSLRKGTVRKRMGNKLNASLCLRTRKFDRYCTEFLTKHPTETIVELGCGLSTRFPRIDNQKLTWYDLDLPEVITIRKQFFTETDRYHFIPSSVLDFSWVSQIKNQPQNILFIAEGLFMYLHQDDVKNLLITLQKNFPDCELACEVANTFLIKTLQQKRWRKKFQKDFHLGEEATFHFGITDSNTFEHWNTDIEFLDDWTYFDDKEKKLGWMNFFRHFKKLKKAQWIVHYKLH